MTTAKLFSIGSLFALASCESKQEEKNEALAFLQAKNYAYITSVASIPTAALNRIAAVEGDTLRICDVESGLPINLSDVGFGNECRSKLNFALVGDSTCLLSYLKGGRGVHEVVYYLTYKGPLRHRKYDYATPAEAENIEQLTKFLQKQPADFVQAGPLSKKDSLKRFGPELAPPPPWPQKITN